MVVFGVFFEEELGRWVILFYFWRDKVGGFLVSEVFLGVEVEVGLRKLFRKDLCGS